jgi:hypothetical protein
VTVPEAALPASLAASAAFSAALFAALRAASAAFCAVSAALDAVAAASCAAVAAASLALFVVVSLGVVVVVLGGGVTVSLLAWPLALVVVSDVSRAVEREVRSVFVHAGDAAIVTRAQTTMPLEISRVLISASFTLSSSLSLGGANFPP